MMKPSKSQKKTTKEKIEINLKEKQWKTQKCKLASELQVKQCKLTINLQDFSSSGL